MVSEGCLTESDTRVKGRRVESNGVVRLRLLVDLNTLSVESLDKLEFEPNETNGLTGQYAWITTS